MARAGHACRTTGVYTLGDYAYMLSDGARVRAYTDAIRAVVRPGHRVVEIGAGFGFFAIVAARAGAAYVDAIETNPVVHLGPRVAAANGVADRVSFHHADSKAVVLPEGADVVIADLRGPTPFCDRALHVLIDARRRLARPGAAMLAAVDRVMVAPARTPRAVERECLHGCRHDGLILDPVERVLRDTPMRSVILPDALLAGGRVCITLDYRTLEGTDHEGSAEWRFGRALAVDGFALWFETDLGGGVGFSTAPGSEVKVYSQLFVPLRAPLSIGEGDTLRVGIGAALVNGQYVWRWRTWTSRADQHEILRTDQNSVAELVLDPAALASVRPRLPAVDVERPVL